MKKNIIATSLSIFLINGCMDSPSAVEDIESILLALLDKDEAVGVDGFDSGGDMDLDHDIGLETEGMTRTFSDTLSFGEGYRLRFGRQLIDRERTVEFETGQDTAIGLITHTVNGEFIAIAIDTNQNEIDSLSFSKEFTTTLTRKVRFIKVDDPASPDGYRWKIDALTPMVGGSGDKVALVDLSFYSLTDSLEVNELLYFFSSDELGDLYINRESLPVFTSFSRVVAYANVTNNGPEYTTDNTGIGEWVFLNYGRNSNQRGRRHLHDSGLFFDQVMNDNIHSGGMRVHGPGPGQIRGVFRTFIETVDLATMFVSDGGYNTNVWSIPYRVERP
tara:strand:- start:2969 stop:3964 length:996 start_codon:yes stop_codon:yes gene_type:complete